MTYQEKEDQVKENQKIEAGKLLEKFLSQGFAMEDAKKAALILCDEIGKKLPSINDTPPIKRKSEENYGGFWLFGVSSFINGL